MTCVLLHFPKSKTGKEHFLRPFSFGSWPLFPRRVCYFERGCCLSIAPQYWRGVVWLECCSFVPFHVLLTGVGDSMSNPVLLSYSTFFKEPVFVCIIKWPKSDPGLVCLLKLKWFYHQTTIYTHIHSRCWTPKDNNVHHHHHHHHHHHVTSTVIVIMICEMPSAYVLSMKQCKSKQAMQTNKQST